MILEFTSENYYFCPVCGEYAMLLVSEEEYDYRIHKIYECVNCGGEDRETIEF